MATEIEIKEILQKIAHYCMRGEKCKFDIRRYLKSYQLNPDEHNLIIEKLIANDFINEERYVKSFINDKFKLNKWGKIKITNELKSKGITGKIVNNNITKIIDNDKYLEVLTQLLKQKQKQMKKKNEVQEKASLMRYGLSRGFEYDVINKILDKIIQ
jgi:regulatory protein